MEIYERIYRDGCNDNHDIIIFNNEKITWYIERDGMGSPYLLRIYDCEYKNSGLLTGEIIKKYLSPINIYPYDPHPYSAHLSDDPIYIESDTRLDAYEVILENRIYNIDNLDTKYKNYIQSKIRNETLKNYSIRYQVSLKRTNNNPTILVKDSFGIYNPLSYDDVYGYIHQYYNKVEKIDKINPFIEDILV